MGLRFSADWRSPWSSRGWTTGRRPRYQIAIRDGDGRHRHCRGNGQHQSRDGRCDTGVGGESLPFHYGNAQTNDAVAVAVMRVVLIDPGALIRVRQQRLSIGASVQPFVHTSLVRFMRV